MNAVLTINKVKVALPETTTSFVYDGTAKVAVNAHNLYTVESATQTNAGSYEAVVTLKDTVNYEWAEEFNGKVAWTIEKATYNMSGITFTNVTVTYDGDEHEVKITGTLPEGVTVSYTTNKGTNAGTYNAVAKFTGDTNYNAIPDMNAVLTIKTASMAFDTNKGDDKPEDVIVIAPEGIDPNKELYVEMVAMEELDKEFSNFAPKGHRVGIAYDVKLLIDGVSVQPDDTLIIKMLIPEELKGKNFSIMHVHNNGDEVDILTHTIEGDYVIVETDKLSEFVFVYEIASFTWLIILLTITVVLEVCLLAFLIYKKKHCKKVKLNAAYPPFIFGMFLPLSQLVVVIILAVTLVALTTTNVIFACKLLGSKKELVLDTNLDQSLNLDNGEEDLAVIDDELTSKI